MINILYIFVTLPIGGAEQHLLTVLKNMDLSHYNPTVLCIREKGAVGEEIEKSGFHFVELKRNSKRPDFRIVSDILRVIREKKIHLIHTHLYHANMYGRIAAIIAGIPVVSTEHNAHASRKRTRDIINRLLAKKTGKMIAVSRAVRDHVALRDGIDPAKVEVVYNGIDITRFSTHLSKAAAREKIGIPENCFLVGTVGRLSEEKGHEYLIGAIHRVKDVASDVRLMIVGSGPMESHLKKMVADQDMAGVVLFTGFRRDIPEMLNAMDVFVFPSLREGFPVALLEAMASRLPVLATPVGGVTEIIEDGINGIFNEPRDENGLAKSIIDLYRDANLRKKLGDEARMTIVEKFSALTMVNHLDSVYGSILARAGLSC